MSQGVRVLAALTPTGDHLLDAARKLCSAFTDLLKAVQPDSNTVCKGLCQVYISTEFYILMNVLGTSKFT